MIRTLFSPRSLVLFWVVACLAILPVSRAQQASAPAAKTFSQQELDELLAPIALYPDALLAQVLMASTYPLEIVEAARWSKANPDVKGKALEDAMQKQPWDPSVKALTSVPQVLTMMDQKLDWTQKLGDAFLAQQADVMKTAQKLRAKAEEAGNLKSTPEQTVKTEKENNETVYVIDSANPDVIYVPTYNPAVIYGTWWYPYPPPYYYYPPGYVVRPGLWFATGIIVGGAIWGGCNWGRNQVNININRYNSFNRTNISNGSWKHNVEHRKGVAYRDSATAQRYNRGGDARAVQSREQFRGRAEAGRAELQGMDRNQLRSQVATADRAAGAGSGSQRGADLSQRGGRESPPQRDRAAPSQRDAGGAFSGANNGAASRAASARGQMSRGHMRAGGGGRGRR